MPAKPEPRKRQACLLPLRILASSMFYSNRWRIVRLRYQPRAASRWLSFSTWTFGGTACSHGMDGWSSASVNRATSKDPNHLATHRLEDISCSYRGNRSNPTRQLVINRIRFILRRGLHLMSPNHRGSWGLSDRSFLDNPYWSGGPQCGETRKKNKVPLKCGTSMQLN